MVRKLKDFWIRNGWEEVFCSKCNIKIAWFEDKIYDEERFFHFNKQCYDKDTELVFVGVLNINNKEKVAKVFKPA